MRAALQNARFEFPARRITVNLAPADLPKECGRFDLPIALGILAASGQIPGDTLAHYEFAGELALTGELRPIRGALAMTFAMHAQAAAGALHPAAANAAEAALVADATILPADSLLQVCAHFAAATPIAAGRRIWPAHRCARPTIPDLCRSERARRRPSARWKLPPPAGTAC